MVNNLGATTEMELAIVARHAVLFLESKGFTVERIYAGTFLSSLDMAGISISVLGINDDRLRWLDAPTTAPAWPNVLKQRPGKPEAQIAVDIDTRDHSPIGKDARTEAGRKTKQAIEAACKALIDAERELTEWDRITGDGDLGTSMERAARAMKTLWSRTLWTMFPRRSKPSAIRSGANWADLQDRCTGCSFCIAARYCRVPEQPGWPNGPKQSIRAARPSVRWVAQSPAIAPCWMRSTHSQRH